MDFRVEVWKVHSWPARDPDFQRQAFEIKPALTCPVQERPKKLNIAAVGNRTASVLVTRKEACSKTPVGNLEAKQRAHDHHEHLPEDLGKAAETML
eukprot:1159855-Pelagomonas_calceolata.AAC.8